MNFAPNWHLRSCANDACTGCLPAIPAPPRVDDHDRLGNGVARPVVVHTQDGRDITCIIYTTTDRGGISCDWSLTTSTQPVVLIPPVSVTRGGGS